MFSSDRIKLSSITALTLRKGKYTTGRRSNPVPQLTCEGRYCEDAPDIVQCVAMGQSSDGLEWKCEADLPSHLKFGSILVGCEGYAHAHDEFILKNSCGLTYELVSSKRYGDSEYGRSRSDYHQRDGLSLSSWLAIGFLLWSLYTWLNRRPRIPHPPTASPFTRFFGGWGGGGGGGGGGGYDGRPPPPPYSKYSASNPAPAPAARDGPGFWTGILGGIAANQIGTALLNRNNGRNDNRGGWGGGNMNTGWGNGGGGSSSGGRSGGGSTSRSAGFGGTRNR